MEPQSVQSVQALPQPENAVARGVFNTFNHTNLINVNTTLGNTN